MHPSEVDGLVSLLTERGETMCCAESCTGGLIGASITDIPGASACFLGSAVTYSNEAKQRLLGVREDTLIAHGAVSEDTAREMALGAAGLFGSDYSVAVTGIAGPGGATETKSVGLVYIAVSDGSRVVVERNVFDGDRQQVRGSTVREACSLLIDFIRGIL